MDQLIARNLYDNVLSIAKFLPAPRRGTALTPGAGAGAFSPVIERVTSPYDAGQSSPFNPNSKTPFPGQQGNARLGLAAGSAGGAGGIERQTCILSVYKSNFPLVPSANGARTASNIADI